MGQARPAERTRLGTVFYRWAQALLRLPSLDLRPRPRKCLATPFEWILFWAEQARIAIIWQGYILLKSSSGMHTLYSL